MFVGVVDAVAVSVTDAVLIAVIAAAVLIEVVAAVVLDAFETALPGGHWTAVNDHAVCRHVR